MSRYPRKIDRAAAERLLRGEPADPRHPDDLLAVLLATAAAPAHAGELAGEEAAVVAFRQARTAVAGLAARPGDEGSSVAVRPWDPAPVRGWIRHPMRLALVALTATTAGGVALANGSVPWSQQPADQRPPTGSATTSQPAGSGSGQGQGGAGTATPHPSFVGLCRAYKAGAGDAPGKTLDNPAFTSLIKAAGGKDKVAAYCADVLTAETKRAKDPTPSGQPTKPDHPGEADQSGRPTPTTRPTGRPTVLPTPTVQPPPGKSTPSKTKASQTRLLSP
jgi:hypothetical protein